MFYHGPLIVSDCQFAIFLFFLWDKQFAKQLDCRDFILKSFSSIFSNSKHFWSISEHLEFLLFVTKAESDCLRLHSTVKQDEKQIEEVTATLAAFKEWGRCCASSCFSKLFTFGLLSVLS